jgi:hypothetical protein
MIMPVKRRVGKAKAPVTEDQQAWLEGRESVTEFESAEALAALWAEHGADEVEEYAADWPGTRPLRWWEYDAPRGPDGKADPRPRLGGIGTLRSDCLAYVPQTWCGRSVDFVTADDVAMYGGPIGLNGKPRPAGHVFAGVPIDWRDPPRFESEAAYLRRHKLLLPGEAARLTESDYEPEVLKP